MKSLGRTHRPISDAELDERLSGVFDDRLTPGAPQTLYSYVRELPMTTPTESRTSRANAAWRSLGRAGRVGVSLAAVIVVAAGAFTLVFLPRNIGTGSGPSAEPTPMPTAPSAPAGWKFQESFGDGGPAGGSVGGNLLPPAPQIAIHVVCSGPDDLVVLASTDPGTSVPFAQAVQGATFHCATDEHGGRVELTAQSGAFQNVFAEVIRGPSSLAYTSFLVSIEVPDETPGPTPSS